MTFDYWQDWTISMRPNTDPIASPLAEFMTIRDAARELGASYSSAYSLAASGLFGEPLIVGRQHFYLRSIANAAIRRRVEQRRRHGRNAPLVGTA